LALDRTTYCSTRIEDGALAVQILRLTIWIKARIVLSNVVPRQATEEGLVTISLRLDILRCMEISARMSQKFEVARALSDKPVSGLIVAQSLGGLNSGESFDLSRVTSLVGEKLHARVYHLYVPAVVATKELRAVLLGQESGARSQEHRTGERVKV
jgi:DNA-binding transcriptional regulator LsrR (DeoR family)